MIDDKTFYMTSACLRFTHLFEIDIGKVNKLMC